MMKFIAMKGGWVYRRRVKLPLCSRKKCHACVITSMKANFLCVPLSDRDPSVLLGRKSYQVKAATRQLTKDYGITSGGRVVAVRGALYEINCDPISLAIQANQILLQVNLTN